VPERCVLPYPHRVRTLVGLKLVWQGLGVRVGVLACLVSLSLSFAGPAGAAVGLAFETITVSNSHMGTVKSRMVLQPNHRYRITVSGTVSDWCPASATSSKECGHGSPLAIGTGVDALYCCSTWRCPTPVPSGSCG